MSENFYEVAVNAPINDPLTYRADSEIDIGARVLVPLGKRKVNGVVLKAIETPSTKFKIKPLESYTEETPPLQDPYIKWCQWLANYYHHPIGSVLNTSYPPLKKKSNRKSTKKDVVPRPPAESDLELTPAQAQVLQDIPVDGFFTHLVHGVTGSGKTEIYLRLLKQVLKMGKSGIVLVPEIALTPQLITRFAARFGEKIAVIHSQLTPREKTNQWWSIVNGETKILIGARSALFCPIPNLGLIVVDEEHEASYKQDEKLRYSGRDAAIKRAQLENIPVILGSATPSLESYYNATLGKYKYHHISHRVKDLLMPEIQLVDLRSKKPSDEIPFWMSTELYEKMNEYLQKGEQVACFLNRRGIAQVILCTDCGAQKICPDCDINLTLHNTSHLVCHYCGYSEKFRDSCDQCGTGHFEPIGIGTEKIEEDLRELFPEKNIQRADRDEINSRESMEEVIDKMESGEIDILVGTQMISKGLDFPNLNFVAVILADISLNMPDFRASERAFQLLTQVAGRAGRHRKGEVILQTYNPEHIAIEYSKTHNYLDFAEQELSFRKELKYPPFSKTVVIRSQSIIAEQSKTTIDIAARRANLLRDRYDEFESVQILGPAECPLFKIRNRYRYMMLIKGPNANVLSAFIKAILADLKWVGSKTKVIVDVDPMNMM